MNGGVVNAPDQALGEAIRLVNVKLPANLDPIMFVFFFLFFFCFFFVVCLDVRIVGPSFVKSDLTTKWQ